MHLIYCPKCNGTIEVESINCEIFRHAVYKNGDLYDPHSTPEKVETDRSLILGCGVAFRYTGLEGSLPQIIEDGIEN